MVACGAGETMLLQSCEPLKAMIGDTHASVAVGWDDRYRTVRSISILLATGRWL